MDITTTYLGLKLRSPLVPSAAQPLTEEIDNVKRLEDAGAGAVVLHSIFAEQLRIEQHELHYHTTYGTDSFAEALTYFPEPENFQVGPETYLEHIRKAKEMVDIPIIASLNGSSLGDWVDFSKQIQAAGADALELNIYNIPTELHLTGAEVEQNYLDIVEAIRADVTIPLTVKLSPFFSNLANMATKLDRAGANGLVLFNRFMQPDISPEELEVWPHLSLSNPQEMLLPMRWIAILYGRIDADLAATTGIQKGLDVVKMLMVGARVTHVCAALLRHGIPHLRKIEQELIEWMEEHEYESVDQMIGTMSQINVIDPSAFERAQYQKVIQSFQREYSLV
ncbi:MAG TPA: dihydroorotate dehydrogenase-like protein [Cyanobacteria bacterium UBA11149]|nr:dihydroorotate dehydrogenase-like protein [Cyanobacteria bacterium UBA11367]HBE57630.1 dihydroorotate dehydrogenase-like protein [Cyanobacteria bacterium UBA11366]HBK62155.1 dihydroorotate dehydrogenase-like protein [Cyanobacteria bacterium UBA11166]HBR72260.1 dihydroorotate dehydrogenase-like protein [Cyanobacteria bacterium UBA11159]HBS71601.1 dihydroorotate dehydrogenase-like protein [Cyanobacteria bacterium UBA11153]HBW88237.1 dihydroorotate dehydrogenase-like protein [Cyanobacteria bac